MNNRLVFYCTWGVRKIGDDHYISPLHNLYLNEALKYYDEVILLSSLALNESDCKEKICSKIKVYLLPSIKNYVSSYKHFFSITNEISKITNSYSGSTFYLRTPQPLCWYFLFHRKNSKLIYHFMSNPIEAILTNDSVSLIKRWLKLLMYFPDFLMTVLASRLNYCSCNGKLLKEKLHPFISNKSVILNESTLSEEEFIPKQLLFKRDLDSPIRLLYVGYLREGKGLDYLLDAIRSLLSKGYAFKLDIIGDGDCKEKLISSSEEKGIKEYVNFLGHISQRELLIQAYRNSDVFVFPSLSEGSPRVVIEAMANGLPCVATNVGNTKNLLGMNGICVQPGSANDLSEGIETYITNENLRYKHAVEGLEKSRKYTLSNFFLEFSKI
ncbi:glycosyltransferase family 4 protein [Vibrio breoganii]